MQVFCKAECESAFADGLVADLTGKVVETAEDVGMNLLQGLYYSTSSSATRLLSRKVYAFFLLLPSIVLSLYMNQSRKVVDFLLGISLTRGAIFSCEKQSVAYFFPSAAVNYL